MAAYGIGAMLRAERVRRGLSLDDVARKTRISPRFLTGIEEEDFDALPGLVFARGFIRQYSNLLNLDTDSLLARMPKPDTSAMPLPDASREDRFLPSANSSSWDGRWDPRWNSAISSILWVGLALGAAAGAYVYFNRSNPELGRSDSPAVASRQSEPAKPAPPIATPTSGGEAAVSASATPAPQTPAELPDVPKILPTKPVQVTLTALEPAWVSLTADGKVAYMGTLQANESKSVEADTIIKLTAGNAGGIKVSLNGKDIETLGPRGQVRVVRLTAEGLQLLSKTPAAPRYDPL